MDKRLDPDTAPAPVVGIGERYEPFGGGEHAHRRVQLLYAVDGSLTIRTENGLWVLPTNRALLIPSNTSHALFLRRPAELRTIYIDPSKAWAPRPTVPVVVSISMLVRALILEVVGLPWDYSATGPEARLARVLCDRLQVVKQEPVHLPEPRDPRARRLCESLRSAPGDRRPLSERALEIGASVKTLERLFRAETGLSPGEWIQQLRLMLALERIAHGDPIGEAAFSVGFENPSSFIALFRRRFGRSPARYFANPDPI